MPVRKLPRLARSSSLQNHHSHGCEAQRGHQGCGSLYSAFLINIILSDTYGMGNYKHGALQLLPYILVQKKQQDTELAQRAVAYKVILIFILLYVMSLLTQAAFKVFSLSLVQSTLIMTCLGVVFPYFLYQGLFSFLDLWAMKFCCLASGKSQQTQPHMHAYKCYF